MPAVKRLYAFETGRKTSDWLRFFRHIFLHVRTNRTALRAAPVSGQR
jgi:hypothetical protein